MRLAFYQPEIPQNTGTLMRLCACFGIPFHIIEPCGFVWDDARLKRAGMDYRDIATVTRFATWDDFKNQQKRIILLDTKATTDYLDFSFQADDTLLLGRESNGVPENVFQSCFSVKISMRPLCRSLNVAIAAGIVLGEALRQTGK